MENTPVRRTDNASSSASDAASDAAIARPSEAQLQKDIRYFEAQVARLAAPSSSWEHGALRCYQVLLAQRRELLSAVTSSEPRGN
jgi:hypothetical protein